MTAKEIVLRPIKETSSDFEGLERAIKELFKKEVYYPTLRELGEPVKKISNATDALNDAIRAGRIQFNRGQFSGRFNAAISRELRDLGAQWDRKTGTFKILQSALPMDVRSAISTSAVRFQETVDRINARLEKILPEEIADKLDSAKYFDASLWKTDKEFQSTLKGITVAPQLSKPARARIADEWQNNMKLWIKDFAKAEITKLRENMQKSVFAGNRYESAVKTIQKSYGVTENKAKFLARQETALLMAKFKETRYQDAGIKEYIWNCVAGSKNHPVRPWHKALEGKKYRWDTPPVTTKPGEPIRRNNPGQDYNCRCFARPVVKFKS